MRHSTSCTCVTITSVAAASQGGGGGGGVASHHLLQHGVRLIFSPSLRLEEKSSEKHMKTKNGKLNRLLQPKHNGMYLQKPLNKPLHSLPAVVCPARRVRRVEVQLLHAVGTRGQGRWIRRRLEKGWRRCGGCGRTATEQRERARMTMR